MAQFGHSCFDLSCFWLWPIFTFYPIRNGSIWSWFFGRMIFHFCRMKGRVWRPELRYSKTKKYSNCGHCSLLSSFLFRVTSAFTSAFLFRVGYICTYLSCWWWLQVLTSAFLFVICTSLSCRWTSALIFRVGGHLHFSFVLATSALIFRVGVDCKYLHPHFSFVLHLHLSFVLATSAFLFVQKLTSAVGQVPESCCIRGAAR